MAHILVLDDVADAVNLIKRILAHCGHTIHGFVEEEEAIAFARSHALDLAILDIKLKRMSGVAVLEELKRSHPALKAIMLTGYPTLETARAAAELGATDYCVKPIDNDELEAKVAQALT